MKTGDNVLISPEVTHKSDWTQGTVIEVEDYNSPLMPPLTYIHTSEADRTTAGGRGEAMPEREIIIVKREQIMAETFGHSKDLITLSRLNL